MRTRTRTKLKAYRTTHSLADWHGLWRLATGDWRLAMDTPSAQAGLSSFQPSPTSRSYDICTSSPSTPRNLQRMFWVCCIVRVKGWMTCMASSAVYRRRRKCPVCLKVYTRMSSSTRHKVLGPSGPDGDTDTPIALSLCAASSFNPPYIVRLTHRANGEYVHH